MHTLGYRLFKLADFVLLLTMILGSPLTATIAQAASAEPAAAESPAVVESDAASSVEPQGGGLKTILAATIGLDPVKNGCMGETSGYGTALNCTANDVSIANVTNISILDDGCAYPGDTVTFSAAYEVTTTATERYDIGLYFANDGDPNGDGARTGSCTIATLPYADDPPWLNLDAVAQPTDTCGDISKDGVHTTLYPVYTITATCEDPDGNGKMNLPSCTSWRVSGSNDTCTTPTQAFPSEKSKCKCQPGMEVPIKVPGQIIVDKVTDPSGDPTSFDFTLTGGPGSVNKTFSLTDASAPYKSTFLDGGTYSVVETANASYSTTATCSDGSPANAIALAPGETVTCTFTNKLQSGTLIVKKDLINDNLGTKTCPDFSYKVDGGSAVPFETDCSNSQTVQAGSHTVVEVGVPIDGYTTTYNNCENVSVPAGGSATCTITNDDVAKPAISVTKSSTTTSITNAGQVVPYSFVVKNAGNQTLTGITVADAMCDNAPAYQSGDGNGDNKLQVTESWTYTCDHTVTQAEIDAGGNLSNTVTADSNETGPATDSLNIPISQKQAIIVVKASTTATVDHAGQVVPYTFDVSNDGNVTLTEITVTDTKCDANPAYVSGDANGDNKLQVSEVWKYTCDHTVTQAEIDAGGMLSNTVTADSKESPPDTDKKDIPIDQNPVIDVAKTSTTTAITAAGQIVPYKFVVTNAGNMTLTEISVSDAMCDAAPAYQGGDTNSDGKLQLTESWTYTCSHTVTQAEIDGGGNLSNTVTAGSKESQPATDSLEIPITQNQAIIVVKASTTATVDHAGQVVPYTFEVSNGGNVTLTGITVTDPKCDAAPAYVSGDTNTDQKLQVSEKWLYTCNHTVTQGEIDAGGNLSNTVTADSKESPPDTDTKDIPIDQNPMIAVKKTSTTTEITAAGQVVPYTFEVSNPGNMTLTEISVTDPMCSAPPAYQSGDTNSDGKLQLTETWTYTCSHTVTQTEVDGGGNLSNTVTAGSKESQPATDSLEIPITQNQAIIVVKASTTATVDHAGQVVPYTFDVSNGGNVTLTEISVTDPMCNAGPTYLEGDTNTDNKLQVGEVWKYSCDHIVTQAEIDKGGDLSNTVTADSKESPPDTDTKDIPIDQNPAIAVQKTSTTTEITTAGQIVPYKFEVTNAGNMTLTEISVTDPMCSAPPAYQDGDTNGDSKLQLAESWIYTCDHTVTQTEVDGGGNLSNTVTAGSKESQPATDSLDIPITQNQAIIVVKASTTATVDHAGQIVPYTFEVSNGGNVTLTGITVTDPKCDAAPAYVSGDTNTDQKLQVGEKWLYTCDHTVTQDEIDAGGMLSNTVTADSKESEPDTDKKDIPIEQKPAIAVKKTSTTTEITTAGQVVPYTFEVSNPGNMTLTEITVTDQKCAAPPVYQSGDDGDGKLQVGEKWIYTCSHTVTQTEIDAGGNLSNTVTADSKESQPTTDSLDIPITQKQAIIVVKASTTVTVDHAGQVVPYTFDVSNDGNVTLTEISVTDPMCDAAPKYVEGDTNADSKLQVSEVWKYTCNHTVTQAEIDAGGNLSNTVTADSKESPPDTDTKDIPIDQNPAISVKKTSTTTAVTAAGQIVPYKFVVSNPGNITLTEISITDAMCDAAPAYQSGDANADGKLQVTESWIYTCSHTVTRAEFDAGGKLSNTVTADSKESEPATSSLDIPITQNPAIKLTKSASPVTYKQAGDVITYTLVAKNTGNVTLHDVSISDDKIDPLTLKCTPNQPATLAPTESLTCTGTYTIQQADLSVSSVTNTATVNGKGPLDQPVTDTTMATVYRQAAALLPTQTTCQQYAAGPSAWPAMYDAFTYVAKGGKINSVSPGVIFYYNTITAPSASFTLSVVETNTSNWKPMLIQDLGQAILYTADCSKASGVKVTTSSNPYTVKFTVTGATAGATYIIGIKYSPANLVGQSVKTSPSSTYTWDTSGYMGSKASIPVVPKK